MRISGRLIAGFAMLSAVLAAAVGCTIVAVGTLSQAVDRMMTLRTPVAISSTELVGKMSEIVSTVASAVEEQGAATQEISRNVQQAAQGTQQVSSNIADLQRGATETGSASTQVLAAVQLLSRDSNRPKDQVSEFLESVRAA